MYKEVKYKFGKASQMVDQPCDILPYLWILSMIVLEQKGKKSP